MMFIKMILVISTLVVWALTLMYPMAAVKLSLKYTEMVFKNPLRIFIGAIISIGIWWLWISMFGFWMTLGISALGTIIGGIRGFMLRDTMFEEIEKMSL